MPMVNESGRFRPPLRFVTAPWRCWTPTTPKVAAVSGALAADRYAASRQRSSAPQTEQFARLYEFALDEFQLTGCRALEAGRGVLVAAPTGSGKTVVRGVCHPLCCAVGHQVLLHHAHQGFVESEVRGVGGALWTRHHPVS